MTHRVITVAALLLALLLTGCGVRDKIEDLEGLTYDALVISARANQAERFAIDAHDRLMRADMASAYRTAWALCDTDTGRENEETALVCKARVFKASMEWSKANKPPLTIEKAAEKFREIRARLREPEGPLQ